MKKNNSKQKMSLVKWMITVNLISIAVVGFVLALNTGIFLYIRVNDDYKEIATATSVNVANVLDSLSDDPFNYDEETGILKKGDIEITDAAFWKSQQFDENVHHTIFWGKTRVLTDVKDEAGNIVVGTTLTDENIIKSVEKDGLYTDNNVRIYGSRYSVCYYPLKNENTIVGYVFTGVNQEVANGNMNRDVFLSVVITIILAVIIIVIVGKTVKKKALQFNEKLNLASNTATEKKGTVTELGHETNANMEQINLAITQMSQAVTQQASHTEEIMGTMENFGDNLEVIMNKVTNTSSITKDSTILMDELKTELESLEIASKENSDEIVNITGQIEEDGKAVESIGQIVNVINDIAFQITILSFNASVEAARAGEAGKGFAVVAESIKELSDKTQASVDDITRIIEAVNAKMVDTGLASKELMAKNERMVEALAATKERMSSVTEAFDKIADNIGMIQDESGSILVAKNQVVETVASLAAASEENAAMSQEITATSNVVINTTEGLMGEIDHLQLITDTIDMVKMDFIR